MTEIADAGLVIDAAGVPDRAGAIVARGGVLGLLGTPRESASVPALAVHRGGRTVVGMHELATVTAGSYQAAYTTVATWLADGLDPQLTASWCRIVPGERAPQIFAVLGTASRPTEPVILFEWAP